MVITLKTSLDPEVVASVLCYACSILKMAFD